MTEFAKAAESRDIRELSADAFDRIAGGWGVGVFFGNPQPKDPKMVDQCAEGWNNQYTEIKCPDRY